VAAAAHHRESRSDSGGVHLIAAAGVLDLTTHVLERAKQLATVQGIAEKDLQQAVSDQQTGGRAQGSA